MPPVTVQSRVLGNLRASTDTLDLLLRIKNEGEPSLEEVSPETAEELRTLGVVDDREIIPVMVIGVLDSFGYLKVEQRPTYPSQPDP